MLLLEISESRLVGPHENVLWRISRIEIAESPCIRTERQKHGGTFAFDSSQSQQKAKVFRVAKALRYLFSGASTVTTVRTLDGKMETGDAATLKNLIKAANADHKLVSGIRLNSPGGSLGEGAKLAEIIRYGKIATVVPSGAQCASACFLIFATGPEKYASCTANVCVHGASNQSGLEEGSATISMGRAIKELGIPGTYWQNGYYPARSNCLACA